MGPPVVAANGALTGGNTVTTTASFAAETASARYLVISARNSGSAFTDTTTVTGGGLTWTKVISGITTPTNFYVAVFEGVGESPSAGALTITFSQNVTNGRYAILELVGGNGAASIVLQALSATGTGTTGTVTATSLTCLQRLIGVWVHAVQEGSTVDSTGATWTELHDSSASANMGLEIQHLRGYDLTHTATWPTSSDWVGFLLELSGDHGNDGILLPNNEPLFQDLDTNAHIAEPDEEGPSIPGRPYGTWAIFGS